jgi:tRNA G18 (ribose-2'-O)-methylase SpoU
MWIKSMHPMTVFIDSLMRKLQNDELHRISVDEFKVKKKNPYVLLLDNVRSLHNVGSAFRTADAFLAQKVYLCGITGTPPHREITKTALGATESVAWEYVQDSLSLIKQLKAESYMIVAVEQAEKSTSLFNFQANVHSKYCFIFGNEVFGVQQELVAEADICLEIPQFGTKHSLNIAVSIGIVVWDYLTKVNSIS